MISYFIYFNVVYILPLFKQKKEHFENNENNIDYEKEISLLEEKIKNTTNIEDIKSNQKLLDKYKNLYKEYSKNLKTNAETIIRQDYQSKNNSYNG